jgi:hypothetical protein
MAEHRRNFKCITPILIAALVTKHTVHT